MAARTSKGNLRANLSALADLLDILIGISQAVSQDILLFLCRALIGQHASCLRAGSKDERVQH